MGLESRRQAQARGDAARRVRQTASCVAGGERAVPDNRNTLRQREAPMTNMDLRTIFAMPAAKAPDTSRRMFLKISGGLVGGLILGLAAPMPFGEGDAVAAEGPFEPNPFVKIAPDNTVTVIIKHLDKGQGAATGLSTLVAEELDASHDQIRTEFAPADAV